MLNHLGYPLKIMSLLTYLLTYLISGVVIGMKAIVLESEILLKEEGYIRLSNHL